MRNYLSILVTLTFLTGAGTAPAKAGNNMEDSELKTAKEAKTKKSDYFHVPFKTITGNDSSLADFHGKVVMLVNVASKCGQTKQYAGLEEIYRKYRDKGFVIVGFPANNFGEQEPGSNEEILNFCQTKFDVTFPMMSKISVKGEDKHPLYAYLTEESNHPGEIEWNFTKFLLDRTGKLADHFPTKTDPASPEVIAEVERLLSAK